MLIHTTTYTIQLISKTKEKTITLCDVLRVVWTCWDWCGSISSWPILRSMLRSVHPYFNVVIWYIQFSHSSTMSMSNKHYTIWWFCMLIIKQIMLLFNVIQNWNFKTMAIATNHQHHVLSLSSPYLGHTQLIFNTNHSLCETICQNKAHAVHDVAQSMIMSNV